jgi:hypothetical protein
LSNCITGSRYYFAYLQRADNVDPARSRLLDQRISDCEEGFSGGAGNDAKYDRLDTPKSRNCHAYTQLAIAQHRVNVGARCRFEGSRWSSDYQHHFGWCSSAGVGSGDLRHENDERRKALDGCVFK